MSNRLTDSDKWKDIWFSNLSPHAKLLFIFLCENCNNAGIYEVNKKFMLFYLGINDEELKKSIAEITKTYIKSNDGNRIWIKNYLKYQSKLPLNENNNNHKQILMILKENLSDETKYKGCKEMSSLLPQPIKIPRKVVSTDITKSEIKEPISRFLKPSITQIQDFMKEKEFSLFKSEGERFFNWFESNGWKVGKNLMRSWKGAVNTWIANYYERNKMTIKKSKIDTIKEAHENLDDVDWNQVYNN
jgi:hypothetical protein